MHTFLTQKYIISTNVCCFDIIASGHSVIFVRVPRIFEFTEEKGTSKDPTINLGKRKSSTLVLVTCSIMRVPMGQQNLPVMTKMISN